MAHALEYAYSGLCKGNVYRNQTDDKTINQYSLDNNVIPVVHGHNNIITVEIGTNSPLQKSGMVLDYKLFKSIIKSHLNKYDHSLVLPVENPLVHIYKENYVKNNVKFHMSRIYPLGGNPTSEILATYWWYELYLIFYLSAALRARAPEREEDSAAQEKHTAAKF